MKHGLLPLITAPDGGALSLSVTVQEGEEVIEGSLTDASGNVYPIEDGIPRLIGNSLLTAQKSEMQARDAQVKDYDAMAFLKGFGCIEIPLTMNALGPRPDDRLLEAGCGTGRMTKALAASVRELIAIDFSFESLRVNRQKLIAAGVENVHLVQANLCSLPFQSAIFNRVVSCQVLEHVPDDDSRRTAVAELARVVRPQSTVVLSAYQHSLATRLFGQKQGEHDGGIPFFRFESKELKELLETSLQVKSMTGVLVYLHLAKCVKV